MKVSFRKFVLNVGGLGVASLLSRLARFLFIAYAARIVGVNQFGEFSFAIGIASILIILGDMGLFQIVTRELSKNKNFQHLSHLMGLKLFLSLFVMVIAVIVGFYFGKFYTNFRVLFLMVTLYMVVEHFSYLIFSFLRAENNLIYEALIKILNTFLVVLIGIPFVSSFKNAFSISVSYFIASILSLFFLFQIYNKKIRSLGVSYDREIWSYYLKRSYNIALMGLFFTLYRNMDITMLGWFKLINDVGLYNSAYKILDVSLMPMVILSSWFFPRISSNVNDESRFKEIFHSYFILLFLVALYLGFLIVFWPKEILFLIYGKMYVKAFKVLYLLGVLLVVIYVSRILQDSLIALEEEKFIFRSTMVGVVVNFLLNVYLIPKFSYMGAAVATVLTYVVVVILYFYKFVKIKKFGFISFKITEILAGLFFIVFISHFISREVSVFVSGKKIVLGEPIIFTLIFVFFVYLLFIRLKLRIKI